jgi:multimeric flavodoxin WrbA
MDRFNRPGGRTIKDARSRRQEVSMKALVITANPKKKGALATLTAEATRGLSDSGVDVEEIRLADHDIGYCNFCFKCIRDTESEIGGCSQDDDMKQILEKAKEADGFVFASQVSSGHASARFKTFVERSTYTAGVAGRSLFLQGVPETRLTDKKRFAVTVVTAGAIPSWLRVFCNTATRQMSELARGGYNARVIGKLYAGMIRNGLKDRDREKAYSLGRKLGARIASQR